MLESQLTSKSLIWKTGLSALSVFVKSVVVWTTFWTFFRISPEGMGFPVFFKFTMVNLQLSGIGYNTMCIFVWGRGGWEASADPGIRGYLRSCLFKISLTFHLINSLAKYRLLALKYFSSKFWRRCSIIFEFSVWLWCVVQLWWLQGVSYGSKSGQLK